MQYCAEKKEDPCQKGLHYFKRHLYQEAVESWDKALQENVMDCNQIQEIKDAKNWFLNIHVDKGKKERIINQLNTLLKYYYVEFIRSFRNKDKKELTPVADILINEKDNFFIIDEFNHRIQIYDEKGKWINSFGEKGKESGKFYYPKALAQDSKGNLYVADCWNHRIQKFSPELQFLTDFGSYGEKEGEFNEPYDIAIDKKDRLFIVDRCNHRIQVFQHDGKFLYSFGHRGTILEEDLAEFYGTPKELFSIPAFEFPTKIALDSEENLYVVDSGNCRIQKLSLSGEFVSSFGEKGEEKDKFQYPFDIAINENDQIFVSDMISNRIYQFTPHGLFVLSLKGNGGDNPANAFFFHSPSAITFDRKGRLVAGEDLSTEVRIFSLSHKPTEEIYRKRLLLVPEDNITHCALGNFYIENKRWNDAAKEYVKALDIDKENIDIKIKLDKCLLKAEFSESYLDYLDLIIDFSDQNTENLEKAILKLYEEKYQIEKELLSKQWEDEWEILVNKKDETEMNLGLEDKNKKIDRTIREKLICYRKQIVKKKEHISLLFRLCEKDHIKEKKYKLFKNMVRFIKKDWKSTLEYLEEKSSLSIVPFLEVKNEIITYFYRYLSDHDFKRYVKNKENLTEYFIKLYLNLNNTFLRILRKREKIYSKFGEKTNSYSSLKSGLTSWLDTKESNYELKKFHALIMFCRAKTIDLINNFIGSNLNKLKSLDKRYLENCIYVLEEINWLMWENANYSTMIENYITTHFTSKTSLVIEKFIEKLKNEKNLKKDYMGKTIFALDKISSYDNSDNFNFAELGDFTDKETAALQVISENHEREYLKNLEKMVQLLNYKIENRNLTESELAKNQSLFELAYINSQVDGYDFYQSKKVIIIVLERASGIIEKYLNLEESNEELANIENWINEFWEKNCEIQIKKENEILERLQLEDYSSEALNSFKADIVSIKAILEYFQQKMNTILSSLRHQVNQKISNKLIKKSNNLIKRDELEKALDMRKRALTINPSESASYSDIDTSSEEIKNRLDSISHKYTINHSMTFGQAGNNTGEFWCPACVVADKKGNLLITDCGNHRIQKFSTNGDFISSIEMLGKLPGNICFPFGLAVDKEDFIYVSNLFGHSITKLFPDGKFVFSFGTLGSEEGKFNRPAQIAIDKSQNIYVSDRLNHRIQKFSSNGKFLASFYGKEESGKKYDESGGIFIDQRDEILIGEYLSGQIKKINLQGEPLLTLGKSGIREEEFNSVFDFAKDSTGNIYISDFMNHRIQKFNEEFELIWSFGTYGTCDGNFRGPAGLEIVDSYLFVCDYWNSRIQRFKIS